MDILAYGEEINVISMIGAGFIVSACIVIILANGKGKYSGMFSLYFFIFNFQLFFSCIWRSILLGVSNQERMDLCRHDIVGSNVIDHKRDSTSEANTFVALEINPPKNMR